MTASYSMGAKLVRYRRHYTVRSELGSSAYEFTEDLERVPNEAKLVNIRQDSDHCGEYVEVQFLHEYEDTIPGELERLQERLERIKQHWIEGVSGDAEQENSWHGTMRDLLNE